MKANEEWANALAAWAIPEPILAAGPRSPWGFCVEHFVQNAEHAVRVRTQSHERAREALPGGGSILDVGCGAGAGSLPLTDRAGQLIGIDASPDMLRAFRSESHAHGVEVATVVGSWPEVASQVAQADVVVCHHVAYNVPDLEPFVLALGDHARSRVVMELTAEHPMHRFNDLWRRFHGLKRPDRPTINDALAVIREAAIDPSWESWEAPPGPWFARREDLVTWVRGRACLAAEQDEELDAALAAQVIVANDGRAALSGRRVVTVWWDCERASNY